MNSILVTGCSRGIGLGLIKVLVNSSKPLKHIIATCRNPEKALELNVLAEKHQNLHILQLDVTNYDSFGNLVDQVSTIVKDDGLNVLFNNAGISTRTTRLDYVKSEDISTVFETNAVAPVMLTKACLPLLKKASAVNESCGVGVTRAAVINMSSILGSIESNAIGGGYAYRMSKTALNAATKSMSIDLKNEKILCVAMHPGWVRTDMGQKSAPLDVETCTETMMKTLWELNESNNGTFMQYDGQSLSW